MHNEFKEYDYIISLGGNCTAANQLKLRNLRPCAFPFDYFWLRDINELKKMISELKLDFKNSFKKENLTELTGNMRGTSNLYQYQDSISGFNIIHMFHNPISKDGEYEKVYNTIQRRLNRLISLQGKNKDLLFILPAKFYIEKNILDEIKDILKEKYGNNIDFYSIMWETPYNKVIEEEHSKYIYLERSWNDYDFFRTNIEWLFLDKLKIKDKKEKKLIIIKEIKKGIQINFFPAINTILRLRLYFLGLRIDLCLGKLRD